VGAINGTVLGLIIAGAAWLWKGNVFLGLATLWLTRMVA